MHEMAVAEAEVAVVPSLYEGFSLPAVEAMATGVPLIATTGGAIPEVVGDDGTTAALVPPGDPGALAATLVDLLDDPGRRAAIGALGAAIEPAQNSVCSRADTVRTGPRSAL